MTEVNSFQPNLKALMKFSILFFILSAVVFSRPAFDDYFENKTLRIDYFHTGTAESEIFSLDHVYEEGAWPGTRHNIINDLNLGLYQAQV